MLASFLIGLVGGQRALTPLAAVSIAMARGDLPGDRAAPAILGEPAVAAGLAALALGELAGDKMKSAPDRVVPAGLAARLLATGLASGAVAPRGRFWHGAAIGGITAVAASFPGWHLRVDAMRTRGQTRTGLVEDAVVLAGTMAILGAVVSGDGDATPGGGG